MRPTTGPKLTPANILGTVQSYRLQGYEIQRKLNGDRAMLERTAAGVRLWNRYGGNYGFAVNLKPYRDLATGTVLDGEVYRGEFYPFEQISDGSDTVERIRDCELLCRFVGVPYLFGGVTNDWLMGEVTLPASRTRQFEGVVCKLASAKYVPLKTETQDSPTWTKLRWC
jgi:ATP-dependent DNA ligase